jgi:hypothetical protein
MILVPDKPAGEGPICWVSLAGLSRSHQVTACPLPMNSADACAPSVERVPMMMELESRLFLEQQAAYAIAGAKQEHA